MFSDLVAGQFSIAVVEPIPAQLHVLAEKPYVPVEALQQSQKCLAPPVPRLLQRAAEEPNRTFGTAIGIAAGSTCPGQIWDINDPAFSMLSWLLSNAGFDTRKINL